MVIVNILKKTKNNPSHPMIIANDSKLEPSSMSFQASIAITMLLSNKCKAKATATIKLLKFISDKQVYLKI